MTILCSGRCHVTLAGSPTCMCGKVATSVSQSPLGSQPYPLSGGIFHGYTPQGSPTQPTAGEAPQVSIAVFKAARLAGATHLSSDGKRIYCQRFGATLQAEWDGNGWGCWWTVEAMPPDVAEM
jgi:hypothetical protein